MLLGGTYVLVYYIGMVFCQEKLLEKLFPKYHLSFFLLCFVGWLLWNLGNWYMQYALDACMSPIFGAGINPPGITEMISAVVVMCACYNLEAFVNWLIEHSKSEKTTAAISYLWRGALFLGRNTLDIFLYHLMVQSCLYSLLSAIGVSNIWVLRLVIYGGMFVLPALIGAGIRNAVQKIQAD